MTLRPTRLRAFKLCLLLMREALTGDYVLVSKVISTGYRRIFRAAQVQ